MLSNVTEIDILNVQLLRIFAFHLEAGNQFEDAIDVLELIQKLKPEEPQSHRDLAIALTKRGQKSDYTRALQLLQSVVEGEWDKRYNRNPEKLPNFSF